MKFKDYIGNTLKGKLVHVWCECIAHIDVTGTVVDYYTQSGELMLRIQRPDGKRYDIGENHPNLMIEII